MLRKFFRLSFVILLIFFLFGCNEQSQSSAGNYETQVYFSPQGHIREKIINEIDNCRSSIDLAIFDFTAREISSAFERARKRGVKVRIVADFRQAQGKYSLVRQLFDEGFKVKVSRGRERGIMHDKFAIFDGKILFTGSYNWTNNAENFNYENAVFISDPQIISKYQKEFERLWFSAFTVVVTDSQ